MKTALSLAIVLLMAPLTQQASKAAPVMLYSSTRDCDSYIRLSKCTDCNPYDSLDSDVEYPYSPIDSYDYEQVSCNFPGTCPDGVQRNTC